MTTSIRMILVDAHAIVRSGVRALLERQPGFEVVGEARDGREALRIAREKTPDVVITETTMPGMNGLEATCRITSELSGMRVLCLSVHDDERLVVEMLRAGASGYVLKDCTIEELAHAIRAVVACQIYISPAVGAAVIACLKTRESGGGGASVLSLLTRREREVLQLLAEGRSTKQIASRLGLSAKTIGTHREHLMHKLEIDSVAGLTKYAIRNGLTAEYRDRPA